MRSSGGFARLAGLPWAAWLDSAASDSRERFDILVADPFVTLRTRGATTEIARRDGATTRSQRPPLELLREELGELAPAAPGLPFSGGAVGYFGYDLGRRLERIPSIAAADIAMPDLAIGPLRLGRRRRSRGAPHVARRQRPRRAHVRELGRARRALVGGAAAGSAAVSRAWAPEVEPRAATPTRRRSARVQEHIRVGDCYQVNLTQRFAARAEGDAWHAYLRLREINPAPFAAYLDLPDGKIVSSSPERFLRVARRARRDEADQGHAAALEGCRARPRARRGAAHEREGPRRERHDRRPLAQRLSASAACRAPCARASCSTSSRSRACTSSSAPSKGASRPGKHALDLVAACFPGGSITGAPKVAAMKIIEELEPQRRSVYCGSIGYIGFDGNMDTNIAIRTLVQQGDRVYTWAGGGVVADSNVDAEYQESLDKAAAMLAVMGDGGLGDERER